MKDRFNIENESFEQSKDKVETEYSVNIPMKFSTIESGIMDGWIYVTVFVELL